MIAEISLTAVFYFVPLALLAVLALYGYSVAKKMAQGKEMELKTIPKMEDQKNTAAKPETEETKIAEQKKTVEPETDSEDDIRSNFRLEIGTDSEPEDFTADCRQSTSDSPSSGSDIDWEYEMFKISCAPAGPVPQEQVLLTVTCPINKQFVKAVTDEEGSVIVVATYAQIDEHVWEWRRAHCEECLEKVEESLRIAGCDIPLATEDDFEAAERDEEQVVEEEETVEEKEDKETGDSGVESVDEEEEQETADESRQVVEEVMEDVLATIESMEEDGPKFEMNSQFYQIAW